MASHVACDCGRPIVQPKRGRRRSKCTTCSPPDLRKRTDKLVRDLGPVVVQLAGTPSEPALVASTRRQLEAAGRESSPEGLIVLTLAAQIAAGGGSAAGLAALVREFHASKARALADVEDDADVIDGIFGAGTG